MWRLVFGLCGAPLFSFLRLRTRACVCVFVCLFSQSAFDSAQVAQALSFTASPPARPQCPPTPARTPAWASRHNRLRTSCGACAVLGCGDVGGFLI